MTITELPPPVPPAPTPAAEPGSWALTWRGNVWTEAMLTGQHLATLALLNGSDDYQSLDLDPRHGHQRLMQMLTAFAVVDKAAAMGQADEDTVTEVLAETVHEISTAGAEEILSALAFT